MRPVGVFRNDLLRPDLLTLGKRAIPTKRQRLLAPMKPVSGPAVTARMRQELTLDWVPAQKRTFA